VASRRYAGQGVAVAARVEGLGHGGGTSTGEPIEYATAITAFFLAQLK
jgi:hypothetical protein